MFFDLEFFCGINIKGPSFKTGIQVDVKMHIKATAHIPLTPFPQER